MRRPELDAFERDALAELALVESRQSKIVSNESWDWSGVQEFRSANGWRFCVFIDAGGWDYLEWVVAPDGRTWDFSDGWNERPPNSLNDPSDALMNFRPEDDSVWELAEVVPPDKWDASK